MDRQRTGGWGGEESKLTIELGRVWGYREICSCSSKEDVWTWHRHHKPEENNFLLFGSPLGHSSALLDWE